MSFTGKYREEFKLPYYYGITILFIGLAGVILSLLRLEILPLKPSLALAFSLVGLWIYDASRADKIKFVKSFIPFGVIALTLFN